ncbi:MAG: hypothetical protein WAS34_18775 [Thiolinea sp.]
MEVEIGDLVYHMFTDDNKGVLRVVGTKDIPYKHEMTGDLYPLDGNEVLLIPVKIEKFEPFIHAMKNHLLKADS